MAGVPLSSASVVQPQQAPASLVHASTSVGSSKFFSEEGRVREVLQQLQGRLVNAQQLKLAISQQPPSTGISAASSTQQVSYIPYSLTRCSVVACGFIHCQAF